MSRHGADGQSKPDSESAAGSPHADDVTMPGREGKQPMWQRRRDKVREEIARNRRGEYVVPTWVLVAALAAIVGGWVAVVVFGGS